MRVFVALSAALSHFRAAKRRNSTPVARARASGLDNASTRHRRSERRECSCAPPKSVKRNRRRHRGIHFDSLRGPHFALSTSASTTRAFHAPRTTAHSVAHDEAARSRSPPRSLCRTRPHTHGAVTRSGSQPSARSHAQPSACDSRVTTVVVMSTQAGTSSRWRAWRARDVDRREHGGMFPWARATRSVGGEHATWVGGESAQRPRRRPRGVR